MIGGISGILVKVFFIYTFTTYRFTGQCGLDILNKLTPYGLFKLTPIDNL